MPNIVKELQSIATKNRIGTALKETSFLESVKEHLQSEDKKANEQLSIFGTSALIENAKTSLRQVEVMKKDEIVTREEIRHVCLKYALRFLPAKNYIRSVPFNALNDIAKFKSCNNNLIIKEENFYVIAPRNHFSLEERPPQKDPVLVYKIKDDKEEYKIVSTWGDDFSTWRRIFGYWKSNDLAIVFLTALSICILSFSLNFFLLSEVFVTIAIVFCVLTFMLIPDLIRFGGGTHKEHWNSTFQN